MNKRSPSYIDVETSHGFTLPELLVVLLLIGVMTTSVAVALQGREDPHALRVAAEDLAVALRYARSESQYTQMSHRIIVAEDGLSYQIERAVSVEDGSDFTPVRGMAGQPHVLTDGITLSLSLNASNPKVAASQQVTTPTEVAIHFSSGMDSFAEELLLQNQALDALRVMILPETGQVRVMAP